MDFPLPVLIPQPRQVLHKGSEFRFAREMIMRCAAAARTRKDALHLTRRCLRELGIEPASRPWTGRGANGPGIVVFLSSRSGLLPEARRLSGLSRRSLPPEGYAIDIDGQSVLVAARDLSGLFYAWQTLSQLTVQDGGRTACPAVSVRDWPDLAVRGAHIDLHNLTPTVAALEERLEVLAGYKINTVLLTYGDKFHFRRHPSVSHPGVLSASDVKRLNAVAADCCIDLVPVIQTLGHSANVLVQPRYAHLREREDVLTQFCPLNPDTLDLVCEFLDEAMDAHCSRFIHIGADETHFLGACPRCRRVTEKKGKIGLYIDYVNKVCEFVVKRGRIPWLWDDMLCTSPSKICRLHPEARICYWDYFPNDAKNPFVFFRNHGWYCNTSYWKDRPWWGGRFVDTPRTRDITELPEEWRKSYGGYFSDDPKHRTLHSFPFYRFYQDAGFQVIGCAAARGGEYGYHCPNYPRRMSNIRQMTRVVAQNEGAGVVSTSWSEMLSPDELTMYLFAAAAEEAWAPGAMPPVGFPERFTLQFFGSASPGIPAAMDRISRHIPPLAYTSEDRTDIQARGQAAGRESLKELLDIRIRKFMNGPGLPGRRADMAGARRDAERALALLRRARRSVTRNRCTYEHLVLAAELLVHKARQAELFYRVEEVLRDGGRTRESREGLCAALAHLGREMSRLRTRTGRLFAASYIPYGVRDRNAVLFEGEREKVREYQNRLRRLGRGALRAKAKR